MAQQENNSEKAQRRCCIVKYLRIPFISGLVVSYKYIELVVLSIIMDYLISSMKVENQRIAAVITNLQDGLSSLFFVFVSHILETRTGCFTMITFCATATTQGLMLLWSSASSSTLYAVYLGLFILAIGMSGQKLSENFLQNHLEEKIKGRKESQHGSTQNKKEKNTNLRATILTNFWMFTTSVVGYMLTICLAVLFKHVTYEELFSYAALLMGGTCLLFFFGYVWYSREDLSIESSVCKIHRIFLAAFRKLQLKYPTTGDHYYWKGYKQQYLYQHGEGVRLLPRVPRLFRWLDKAAIVKNEEVGFETQEEKKGKLCTVQEVRAVKSFVPMIYMGLTIFPYSLLMASEATFFVAQASIMPPQFPISVLYFLKAGGRDVARFTYFVASVSFSRLDLPCFGSLRKTGTIIRIGLGIVCAVVCSFVAWRVEVDRLSPNESTTVVLIPQFVLLGAAEGLIDGGLARLFHDNVAESLWSFEDSFSELVIGAGKLLIIPIVFICGSWIKETVDTSRLDKYYLMLGILNTGLFLDFGYYSIKYAYKEKCPEDEKFTEEETDAHQPELQDSSPKIDTEAITSCCCECDQFIPLSIWHIFGI